MTVLIAEDEESFVDALVIGLGREGFNVSVARDGPEALALFDAIEPDLVLLDIMLPKMSGVDVCRAIRARSHVPIIMVTAKGTEIDTVVGLEVGADDYVTKPYRLRELVARMRAVLRRSPLATPGSAHADEAAERGGVLEVGGVRVDPDRHRVFVRGQEVHLRRKEFELLVLLVENAGASSPATPSSTGCGVRTTWATRRPSTSTSSGSGPTSRPTRRRRPSSPRCGAWGTGSRSPPTSDRQTRRGEERA